MEEELKKLLAEYKEAIIEKDNEETNWVEEKLFHYINKNIIGKTGSYVIDAKTYFELKEIMPMVKMIMPNNIDLYNRLIRINI